MNKLAFITLLPLCISISPILASIQPNPPAKDSPSKPPTLIHSQPTQHQEEHKQQEVSSDSIDIIIKQHELKKQQINDIQEELDKKHIPLHLLSEEQVCHKIKWWLFNDIEYEKGLRRTMEIFSKNRLSGKEISDRYKYSKDDCMKIIKNDLDLLITYNTMNIMFDIFEEWKSDNTIQSESPERIGYIMYQYPLKKLLFKIKHENINGKKLLKYCTDKTKNLWIHETTGWDKKDVVPQIESILLQYFTWQKDQIAQKIATFLHKIRYNKEFKTDKIFLSKLNEKGIDLACLQLKVRHNKSIEEEIALVKAVIIEMKSTLEKMQEEAVSTEEKPDFTYYQALTQGLCVNDHDDEKEYQDDHLISHSGVSWHCYYCGNVNHSCIVNSRVQIPTNCRLCGLLERESISRKLRQIESFTTQNEKKNEPQEIYNEEIEKWIIQGYKKYPVYCPRLIGSKEICRYVVRLTRVLNYYNHFILKAKYATDTPIDWRKITFSSRYFDNAVDQALKNTPLTFHHSDKDKIKSFLQSNYNDLFALRKAFAKKLVEVLGKEKINTAKAAKLHKHIKASLSAHIWDTVDPAQLDKDYRHIVKYHINDSFNADSIERSKIFEYFQFTLPCVKEDCYSSKLYGQRIATYEDELKEEEQKTQEPTKDNDVDFTQLNRNYIEKTLAIIHNYLLHTELQRSIKNNDTRDEEDKEEPSIAINRFISAYGFGVYHAYPSMKPICENKSIKDELMRNNQCKIANDTFTRYLMEAVKKHQAMDEDNKLTCTRYDEEYNIIRNTPINVCHILSMIVYTSESTLCTAFRKTYRKRNQKETEENVRERHRQFYYFGRTLCEAIEFYGKEMRNSMEVYHGLDKEMAFESYTAYFNQPISTTPNINIAYQFSKGTGIVLTFKKEKNSQNTPKYLDVSWLSSFKNEKEKLFYGESVKFSIVDIIKLDENQKFRSYKEEVAMMNMLERCITCNPIDLSKEKTIHRLVDCIKKSVHQNLSQPKEKSEKKDKMSYEEHLFLQFCTSQESIKIKNYGSLPRNLKDSLLYNKEEKISFVRLSQLFDNAKELTLHQVDFSEMKKYLREKEYIRAVKELTDRNAKLNKIVIQSEVQDNKRECAEFKKESQAEYIFKREGIHILSFRADSIYGKIQPIIDENKSYWNQYLVKDISTNQGGYMSKKEELERLYVPLNGKENITDPDQYGFDLEDYIKEKFLQQSIQKVLVIIGDGGSGKSTFVQYFAKKMCEEMDKNNQDWIPIYIPLIAVKEPSQDNAIFEGYIKNVFKIDEKRFQPLLEQRKVLFILDGYDEMPDKIVEKGLQKNNPFLNHPDFKCKIVVTTRPRQFADRDRRIQSCFHIDERKVNVIFTAGFIKKKKEAFLTKFIAYAKKKKADIGGWSIQQYLDKFDELNKNNEKDLFASPIHLRITAEVLPKIEKEATDKENAYQYTSNNIYEKFVENYFIRGINKYKESNNLSLLIDAFPKYKNPKKRAKIEKILKKMFWDYAKKLGQFLKTKKQNGKSIYFSKYEDINPPQGNDEQKTTLESDEKKEEAEDIYDPDSDDEAEPSDWELLFPTDKSHTSARKKLAFSVMPIIGVRGKKEDDLLFYRLWHNNMIDFLNHKAAKEAHQK